MHRLVPGRRIVNRRPVILAGLIAWSVISVWFYHHYLNHPKNDYITAIEIKFKHRFIERVNPTEGEKYLEVVHIDLKGTPPKKNYVLHLISKLSRAGIGIVMIEYEDMFPYQGTISDISAVLSYTTDDIMEIVQACRGFGIEIIPMVQTFGRMEHVLKLSAYEYLREDSKDMSTICPTLMFSTFIISEMLTQIMSFHPFSKRIHIGCGKVTSIKKCRICKERRGSPEEIFVEHVKNVATMVRKMFRNEVTPLIWDDMLRNSSLSFLKSSNLTEYVEIVVRDNNSPISKSVRGKIWQKYKQVFDQIWFAGAYRGVDGALTMMPNMRARFDNQDSWLDFMQHEVEVDNSTKIIGYFLTGDSRVNHFAASVDLLPASIPSLFLSAFKIKAALRPRHIQYYLKQFNGLLNCKPALSSTEVFDPNALQRCNFDELDIFNVTWRLEELQLTINMLYEKLYEKNAWNTEFHREREFFSKTSIGESFDRVEPPVLDVYDKFVELFPRMAIQMRQFCELHIVDEWLMQHLKHTYDKIQTLYDLGLNMRQFSYLPRRTVKIEKWRDEPSKYQIEYESE